MRNSSRSAEQNFRLRVTRIESFITVMRKKRARKLRRTPMSTWFLLCWNIALTRTKEPDGHHQHNHGRLQILVLDLRSIWCETFTSWSNILLYKYGSRRLLSAEYRMLKILFHTGPRTTQTREEKKERVWLTTWMQFQWSRDIFHDTRYHVSGKIPDAHLSRLVVSLGARVSW